MHGKTRSLTPSSCIGTNPAVTPGVDAAQPTHPCSPTHPCQPDQLHGNGVSCLLDSPLPAWWPTCMAVAKGTRR